MEGGVGGLADDFVGFGDLEAGFGCLDPILVVRRLFLEAWTPILESRGLFLGAWRPQNWIYGGLRTDKLEKLNILKYIRKP